MRQTKSNTDRRRDFAFCLMIGAVICASFTFVRAVAAIPPEAIKLAKRATALVTLSPGAKVPRGVAFCVDESGIFVMSSAFVPHLPLPEAIELRLQGTEESVTLFAFLVKSDDKAGIAVLQATQEHPFAALPPAKEIAAKPRENWIAIGPTSDQIGEEQFDALEIRLIRPGAFDKTAEEIQFAEILAANLLGGPILNDAGELLGMVRPTELGKPANRAIPVPSLQAQALQPVLAITTSVTTENLEKEIPLEIQVTAPAALRKAGQLELILQGSLGQKRVFHAPATKLRVEIPLIPSPPPAENRRYRIRAVFSEGAIEGFAPTASVQLGDQMMPLSELISYTAANGGEGTLVSGEKKPGVLTSTAPLSIQIQSQSLPLDLSKVRQLLVSDEQRARPPTKFQLALKTSDGSFGAIEGVLEPKLAGSSKPVKVGVATRSSSVEPDDAIDAPLWKPIEFEGAVKRFDLVPNRVDQVIVAGAGRYLVLFSKTAQALALFDVGELKFTKNLKLPTNEVFVAANRSKVFAIFPGLGAAWQIDIYTLQREADLQDPRLANVQGAAAGAHSDRPPFLVIETEKDKRVFAMPDSQFSKILDIAYRGNGVYQASMQREFRIRSSGDGQLLTTCCQEGSHLRNAIFDYYDGAVRERPVHTGSTIPVLGVDSRYFFSGARIEGSHEKFEEARGPILHWLPSEHESWAVRIPSRLPSDQFVPALFAITQLEGMRRVRELPDPVEEIICSEADFRYDPSALSFDDRFHIYPFANLLIAFSADGNHFLVRKVPFRKAMAVGREKHLYVASSPPRSVELGEFLKYTPQVMSHDPQFRVELMTGPTGARVEKGALLWQPQNNQPLRPVTIVLRFISSDETTIAHQSFTVDVLAPRRALQTIESPSPGSQNKP